MKPELETARAELVRLTQTSPSGNAIHIVLNELDRLHTWVGLISLLDEHYPPDVFDGSSGDPGPTIIRLIREIDRLRNAEGGS